MGATFALEVALGAPERVAGVVSINGPGYWPSQGMGGRAPLAQAGHMPHQEQPALVNALIRTALARQAAGTIPTATGSS